MASLDNIFLNPAAVEHLFEEQLKIWPLASTNFGALESVQTKSLSPRIVVQFNPQRLVSSTANTDAQTINGRQCFFCRQGRPKEQKWINFKGITTDYLVQVNPYPIFKRHLVILSKSHSRQELDSSRMADMLHFAKILKDYVVFYNGPDSGASVPDHFHFQAGNKGVMPIEGNYEYFGKKSLFKRGKEGSENYLRIYKLTDYPPGAFVIDAASSKLTIAAIGRIYSLLSSLTGRGNGRFEPDDIVSSESKMFEEGGLWEPRMNILCWWMDGFWRTAFFARGELRPRCYYREGEDNMLISPACVEMGGLFIAPLERDFMKITEPDAEQILKDVSISEKLEETLIRKMRKQPTVSVGIMHSKEITFFFDTPYRLLEKEKIKNPKGKIYEGEQKIALVGNKFTFDGASYTELMFEPVDKQGISRFTLKDVVIGVNFHWERKENQSFCGSLKFIIEDEAVCAINIVGVEDYLASVISSEMSAEASEELLKAHAVISRSWLLAQIERSAKQKAPSIIEGVNSEYGCKELIRWYDREDHKNFDVCADDHCQRYQGVTRASTDTVRKAVDATWGEVLWYEGEICDARFYKCCGGALEQFENCWEDKHYDYLVAVRDLKEEAALPDLTIEQNAREWILSSPAAFCNTQDNRILSQVLNNYDQETKEFYRWSVTYSQRELAQLIREKSGEDFGEIINLVPLERGTSGRIVKLLIVGTKKRMVIGKELEIRRLLSKSHLYSSAFIVRRLDGEGNLMEERAIVGDSPCSFSLVGAGWGHGVGLCQIGAAVMGEKGFGYNQILQHYYPNAEIVKKY